MQQLTAALTFAARLANVRRTCGAQLRSLDRENRLRQFILYGTSACHLCELAEALLQAHPALGSEFEFHKVDISESDELFERYGVRIPVLLDTGLGRELNWPFDMDSLQRFLGSPRISRP